MFCNSTHPQVRAQTAELFAKMTADKLVGPKVRIWTAFVGTHVDNTNLSLKTEQYQLFCDLNIHVKRKVVFSKKQLIFLNFWADSYKCCICCNYCKQFGSRFQFVLTLSLGTPISNPSLAVTI